MKIRRSARVAVVGLVAVLGVVAAACAPPDPGGGPATVNWAFEGNTVKVIHSQDALYDPIFHLCISLTGCKDEPYLIQVAFRVKIGEPGSAHAWVVGTRNDAYQGGLGDGQSWTLQGAQRARVNFTNVAPLDVLDALQPQNKLEIFGTYTWAVERDTVGIGEGASGTAAFFQDALNATLAQKVLPNDPNILVDLILDNIGSAFNILLANIPLFGLGDDTMGSGVYVGIGATGTLGSVIDSIVSGVNVPAISLLGDNMVPPKIDGGKLYTMTGPKTFTQTITGGLSWGTTGTHEYNFMEGPG